MRITVCFEDWTVEEFDTNALTTDSALERPNALTDLRVTVVDGLWVEASWYRMTADPNECMPLAQRSGGCRLHVLSGEKLAQARSIELDGRLQWVRMGGDLCDMSQFDETTDLFHDPDEPSRCVAGRAVWLHDHLIANMPGVAGGPDAKERVCTALGMTEASYEFMSTLAANVYVEEDSF